MAASRDAVLVGLIPALTHNLSLAAQAVRDGATTLIQPGAGLITQVGTVSENPYSFGFALEHLQALGFNLNAALRGQIAGPTKFLWMALSLAPISTSIRLGR
ncbi:MAG: hypothetical protein LVS60_04420 [Nodosilinea sp. LVE1205-7]